MIAASGEYAAVEMTGAAAVAFLEQEGSDLRRQAAARRFESRRLRAAAREIRERNRVIRARNQFLQDKLMDAVVQRRPADE